MDPVRDRANFVTGLSGYSVYLQDDARMQDLSPDEVLRDLVSFHVFIS